MGAERGKTMEDEGFASPLATTMLNRCSQSSHLMGSAQFSASVHTDAAQAKGLAIEKNLKSSDGSLIWWRANR